GRAHPANLCASLRLSHRVDTRSIGASPADDGVHSACFRATLGENDEDSMRGDPRPPRKVRLAQVLAIVLATGVFVIDAFTPPESAEWFLYIFLLFLAGWHAERRFFLFYCAFSSLLTLVGFVLPHGTLRVDLGVVNRLLVVVAVWTTGLLLIQRKRSIDALARNRDEISTVLQSISEAVIATDREGHVTFMNRAAEAMTGWKLAGALGKPVNEVLSLIEAETRPPALLPLPRLGADGSVRRATRPS